MDGDGWMWLWKWEGWAAVEALSVLTSTIVAIITIYILYIQLRNISHSLKISRQANSVSVIAHCASRYEILMGECYKLDLDNHQACDNWWYRYWDLQTEQFNFFRKSLLDIEIYELWMSELATKYQSPPREGLELRSSAHKRYLDVTLPNYQDLRCFFMELDNISLQSDLRKRTLAVNRLVVKYSLTS